MFTVRVSSIESTTYIIVFDDKYKVIVIYAGAAWEYHSVYKWRSAFCDVAKGRFFNDTDRDINYNDYSIESFEVVQSVFDSIYQKMRQIHKID